MSESNSENKTVRLRPMRADDIAWMEELDQDPNGHGDYSFAGFRGAGSIARQFEEDGGLGEDRGRLIVTADDEPVGQCSWHPEHWGQPPASMSFNIGILMRPEGRGQGFGTEAQRQLAAYLFAHHRVNRVEASTDAENLAEQRALEKAGFTREGVARQAQFRDGAYHDMVSYSILRGE